MKVEVAYALPEEQFLTEVEVEEGATAEQAIRASGVLDRYPDIDLEENRIGVFGKLCGLDRVLRRDDRVEIYRPLQADPKEVRRALAAQGETMGKAQEKSKGKDRGGGPEGSPGRG